MPRTHARRLITSTSTTDDFDLDFRARLIVREVFGGDRQNIAARREAGGYAQESDARLLRVRPTQVNGLCAVQLRGETDGVGVCARLHFQFISISRTSASTRARAQTRGR